MDLTAARLQAVPFLLLGAAVAQPVQDPDDAAGNAEAAPDRGQDDLLDDVIVVGGSRQRGVTLSQIDPEVTLTEADIEAYGVSSLAELLELLSAETSSGRGRRGGGRPVVLLNGRRISGFREIGRYPPEALARVEVLPEEAALSYGFPANQRVINFVLKPNVVVHALEGEVEAPDQGGTAQTEGSFQRLSVDGSRRFSLDLRYELRSPLLESERDFISEPAPLPFAEPPNLGADDFGQPIGAILGGDDDFTVAALTGYDFQEIIIGGENISDGQELRTLRPEREETSAGFSRAGNFIAGSILTITGEAQRTETERLLGQPEVALDLPGSNPFVPFGDGLTLYAALPAEGPLLQTTEADTISTGFSVVSKPGRTNWTLTGSYEFAETDTLTELGLDEDSPQLRVDAGEDPFAVLAGGAARLTLLNETTTRNGSADFIINAKPLSLPAGELTVSAQAGFSSLQQEVRSEQGSTVTDSELGRDSFDTQVSVDLPLLFAEEEGGLGDLSINANLALSELSDFGTLMTAGGGFTWKPTEKLRFIGSYTREEGAPSIGELGDPVIVTPNVRVFDFTTGDTVLVDAVSGGNPELIADTRDVAKLGIQWEPFEGPDITLNLDYTQSLLDDEARAFPSLTAEVEAAFPERFTRDENGALTAIDRRPVNFAESTQRQIRTGINWSQSLSRRRGGPPPGVRRGRQSGPPGGPPQRQGAPQADGQGPERAEGSAPGQDGGARGQRGTGRQPTRSGRPGRRFISLYHTWVIEDSILIREGLPELDLLNGSAIGDEGGTPAHQLTLSFRQWNKGLGMFARLNWQSATEVDGSIAGGSDLQFSELTTIDMRLAYDLGFSGGIMKRAPWLRETRVAIGVDNLLNDRIEVRDANGGIPFRYQPDLIDPFGRVFEVEIRKRF